MSANTPIMTLPPKPPIIRLLEHTDSPRSHYDGIEPVFPARPPETSLSYNGLSYCLSTQILSLSESMETNTITASGGIYSMEYLNKKYISAEEKHERAIARTLKRYDFDYKEWKLFIRQWA